jgi:2'-5' RNA ligase
MRLFVALDLPGPILASLDSLTRQLKSAASIAWSPVANLHITTQFLGEWPEARLDEMKTALAQVPKTGPIQISIEGLGWFPNPHSPRVFWAAVHASPALADLARATAEATAKIGVPTETRAYHPHLTLARIKAPTDLAPLRQAVARLDSVEFGEFEASAFYLYLSKPGPSGSIYEKLAEFSL